MKPHRKIRAVGVALPIILIALLLLPSSAIMSGEIALSFDDAPLPDGQIFSGKDRGDLLLSKLADLEIREVVFFCLAGNLKSPEGWERLRRYGRAGHKIANHSFTHERPDRMGATGYWEDIIAAEKLLDTLPGYVRWYRFPMLDEGKTEPLRDSVRDALSARGYRHGYVTVDSYDFYLNQKVQEAIRQGMKVDRERLKALYVEMLWGGIMYYDSLAQAVMGRSPKHILLLHENDLAALCIDSLVKFVRAAGWKIITPSEAYSDSISTVQPKVLSSNQGRVAAIAAEKGLAGPFRHVSENAAYIDSVLAARKIITP